MRIRLSTIKQLSNNVTSTYFQQVTLALMRLYLKDPDTDYNKYIGGTRLLEQCVNRSVLPVINDMQTLLEKTFPNDRVIHLYLRGWAAPEPSHYLVLHRNSETNLFEVKCNRVCSLAVGAPLKKDGILVEWDSDDPVIAATQRPKVKRLYGGGSGTAQLLIDLTTNIEVQRELSLAIYTHSLYADINEISIWLPRMGKVVIAPGTIPTKLYCDLYPFKIVRTRPYVKTITKPNCIVRVIPRKQGALDYALDDIMHIVPSVKNLEPFDTTDKAFSNFLTTTLETRLLPYIGVQINKAVNIYGLVYNQEDDECYPALIAENKQPGNCAAMPLVSLHSNESSGHFIPNNILAKIIRYHMTTLAENKKAANLRYKACRRLLGYCGYTENFHKVFADWRMPLSNAELSILRSQESIVD